MSVSTFKSLDIYPPFKIFNRGPFLFTDEFTYFVYCKFAEELLINLELKEGEELPKNYWNFFNNFHKLQNKVINKNSLSFFSGGYLNEYSIIKNRYPMEVIYYDDSSKIFKIIYRGKQMSSKKYFVVTYCFEVMAKIMAKTEIEARLIWKHHFDSSLVSQELLFQKVSKEEFDSLKIGDKNILNTPKEEEFNLQDLPPRGKDLIVESYPCQICGKVALDFTQKQLCFLAEAVEKGSIFAIVCDHRRDMINQSSLSD